MTNETINLDENNIVSRSHCLLHMKDNPYALGALKILDVFLSKLNPLDNNTRTVKFKKKEYEELIGISKINLSTLQSYTGQLQNTKIVLPIKENGYDSIVLFERCKVYSENGQSVVEMTCSSTAKDIFFNLEGMRYIKYKLKNVIRMNSVSTLFMYYYLIENQYRKKWTVSVEKVKKHLRIEKDKYSDIRNFNKRIIEPSISEINKSTDIRASCRPIKQGRSIVEYEFTVFSRNENFFDLKLNVQQLAEETAELFVGIFTDSPKPEVDINLIKLVQKAENNGIDHMTLFYALKALIDSTKSSDVENLVTIEWTFNNAEQILSLRQDQIDDKKYTNDKIKKLLQTLT